MTPKLLRLVIGKIYTTAITKIREKTRKLIKKINPLSIIRFMIEKIEIKESFITTPYNFRDYQIDVHLYSNNFG